ncbi:hypothetical protein BDV98DRAFT_558598 [Pterulicium gracile]|uniref:DNA-directed RNA polymerase I subunit RPA34.5-domain-containing protein n=1 Tax=Pterulicium gracile TaxID=1884261 RepID=A0A5C3R4D0_9AGAR|nr:hypothetical protein BDV98DRAFT_558598 [Pterula gracilis]
MARSPSSSPSSSSSSSDTDTPSTRHKSSKSATNNSKQANWAWKPPPNARLLDHEEIDAQELDWDAINGDDDCEVWLIRVPETVKPRHLDGLILNTPAETSRTTQVGSLERKHTSYNVYSLGDEGNDLNSEEMNSLSFLVPRKSKGKLFKAPKPIARRIVISPQAPVPTQAEDAPPINYQNPPRPSYPPEVLKHKFAPTGASVTIRDDDTMDIDAGEEEVPKKKKQKTGADGPESPKKSRKKAVAS